MEETWNMEDESRSSDRTHSEDNEDSSSGYDTLVYPLIQMGPFGITHDENITLKLFRSASQGDEILLASGYFNLTNHYMNVILQESYAKYGILMASPEVHHQFNVCTSLKISFNIDNVVLKRSKESMIVFVLTFAVIMLSYILSADTDILCCHELSLC